MSSRRSRGATLGLVVVSVLAIIVIGVACFLLMKIAGGGREVTNATDAGTLNIARQAMLYPGISQEGDFALLTVSQTGSMSLINYNRAVAQTLLIALNAQDEGTPTAISHAQAELSLLNAVGATIASRLADPTKMGSFFTSLSSINSNKMMGGKNGAQFVNSEYQVACMHPGWSTNVYFDMGSFPQNGPPPANLQVSGNTVVPGVAGLGNFMAGYLPFTVPGVGTMYGVPVLPGQNPHLVSLKEFGTATPSIANTPQNAFKAGSQAMDAKTNTFGGAVACSIVGMTRAKPETNQFAGAIPGGYIEIVNYAGNALPPGFQPADNSANLFNNQLFYEPGLETANSGGNEVFAAVGSGNTDAGAVTNMMAWLSWAAAGGTGTQPSNTDGMYIATSPGQAGDPIANPPTPAQLQILQNMGSGTNCLDQLNSQGSLSGSCGNWLSSYAATFNPLPTNGSSWPGGSNYSVVDEAKADLLAAFQNSQQTFTLPPEFADTGLGVYAADPTGQNRPIGSYGIAWPASVGPMQQTGTIMQLLQEVDGQPGSTCALSTEIAALLQRCKEIKPGCTQAEMEALFSQTLCPMGATLYLYRSAQGTGPLVINNFFPPMKSIQDPDGSNTAPLANCEDSYDVMGTLVDTSNLSTGGMGGDDGLHGSPYMVSGEDAIATAHAQFFQSSGYGNLLGQLKFSCSLKIIDTPPGGDNGGSTHTGGKTGEGSSQVMN